MKSIDCKTPHCYNEINKNCATGLCFDCEYRKREDQQHNFAYLSKPVKRGIQHARKHGGLFITR